MFNPAPFNLFREAMTYGSVCDPGDFDSICDALNVQVQSKIRRIICLIRDDDRVHVFCTDEGIRMFITDGSMTFVAEYVLVLNPLVAYPSVDHTEIRLTRVGGIVR